VHIRALDDADVPQLLALYRHLNPDDVETTIEDARSHWQALKRYGGSDIFVGCLDSELVASCTLIVVPNLTRGGASFALIENVVTPPSRLWKGGAQGGRRDRLARRLLQSDAAHGLETTRCS
jgi:hypothetical protein